MSRANGVDLELSVVLPCLNEAETLATCIGKAQKAMAEMGIQGEVVIADNGSTDGSQAIAHEHGARVVPVEERGYGAALIEGFKAARGQYIIMADADDSYALDEIQPYVRALRDGADLVMGNRFRGGIAADAMPVLHRYLGTPVLSFLGRLFFDIPVGDFNCGMRGLRRDAILDLELKTTGMEFASEMIVRAALADLEIVEVPTTLRPDGRTREPHLRTWSDGWRHLRFLLAFSPRWLFLYPAIALALLGAAGLVWLSAGIQRVGEVGFGLHTMLAAATLLIAGIQGAGVAIVSRAYASELGLLPMSSNLERFLHRFTLEKGLIVGGVAIVGGIGIFGFEFWRWGQAGFGALDVFSTMRILIIGMVAITAGIQTAMLSFMLSLTRIGEP